MKSKPSQKTKAKGAATPIAYKDIQSDSTFNSKHNQRLRLLDYLKNAWRDYHLAGTKRAGYSRTRRAHF